MDKITIKTAAYPCRCFCCDVKIARGEAHVVKEGYTMCFTCGLPARRLRPINKEGVKQ
jgi:hypothetical protein